MFTKHRPIKVTSTATETMSGKEKAIENAKTGKVTAVVAVMYLNGKTKVNLRNANLENKQDTDRHGTAIGAQQDTNSLQTKQDPNRCKKAIRAQQETDSPQKTKDYQGPP
jgi:hypothetical protein